MNKRMAKHRLKEIDRCLKEASFRAALGLGDQACYLIEQARNMLIDVNEYLKEENDSGS